MGTPSGPPPAMTALVQAGHRGLSTGRGLHDWSRRDGPGLVEARVEELFRHLQRPA